MEALSKKLCIFLVFETPQNEQGGKITNCAVASIWFFYSKNFLYVFQGQLDDSISENRKGGPMSKDKSKK